MAWDTRSAVGGGVSGAQGGYRTGGVPGALIGGGTGALIGGFFGNDYQDPSEAANKYLEQIRGNISPYYQPYINAGNQGLDILGNQLMPQYQQLVNDPTAMMNKIGAGYTASPGYQYNVDEATRGANAAAAAGGMAGSPAEQQALAQRISGIASQDYNNYMNQGLGQYQSGLQGMGNTGQFMGNLGYGASDQMAQSLMSMLMTQANNAYAGAANQNSQSGGMLSNAMSSFGF